MSLQMLVVDDDPAIRMAVELALSLEGVEVVHAQDGEAALALVETSTFDVILLDVMMPLVDGFTVLQRIRCDDRLRSTPVMMLTAKDGDREYIRAYSAGADGYIAKPFDIDHVVATGLSLASMCDEDRTVYRQRQLHRALQRVAAANMGLPVSAG
jgi:DNA-binding response OmpR family regulator